MNSDIASTPDIQIYSCIQPPNPFLCYDTPPFLINTFFFISRVDEPSTISPRTLVRVPVRILRPFVYCYRQDTRFAVMNVQPHEILSWSH